MEEIKIHTAGDSSVLIEFGQEISPEINAKITAFVHLMKAQHVEGRISPLRAPANTSRVAGCPMRAITTVLRAINPTMNHFSLLAIVLPTHFYRVQVRSDTVSSDWYFCVRLLNSLLL